MKGAAGSLKRLVLDGSQVQNGLVDKMMSRNKDL